VFAKLIRADNTEGANENSTEAAEVATTDDETQTTGREDLTKDLQSAAESEAVTPPTVELEPVPLVAQPEGESLPDTITAVTPQEASTDVSTPELLVAQPEGESLPDTITTKTPQEASTDVPTPEPLVAKPEGESLLDTITAETPQEASTDAPTPELPLTQKHEINDKEENPTEAINENLQQPSSETPVESPEIPPTNTPLEADTNNPISSPKVSDAALISVTDMTKITDTSASTSVGLAANGALSGSTSEFPNTEEAPIEHPALRGVTVSESEASATPEPMAQDLAVEMEAVEPETEVPKIENSMAEGLSAVVTKVKEPPLDDLEAAEDIKVDPELTKPDPQIVESKEEVLGSGLKDSETEKIAAVVEPKAKEPILEAPNAEEPAIKEPVPEAEEPKAAVQESEVVPVGPKPEAIELNDKPDQPKTVEPSSEAEEQMFQCDDPMPSAGDFKPEVDETRPKSTSAIIGMASVGFNKPSLSNGKTSGPSPRGIIFNNLRHSASMSEKRDSPSITVDEAEVEETFAEDSKLDTPESVPSTPTSPSPGPDESAVPTEPATHKNAGKQKRKKGKKTKSQIPKPNGINK